MYVSLPDLEIQEKYINNANVSLNLTLTLDSITTLGKKINNLSESHLHKIYLIQ